MELLGFDVGFSETRCSSGIASFRSGLVSVDRATCSWKDREQRLVNVKLAEVAAIDAPILKQADRSRRSCETVFTLGSFQRRCKPGHSHVPGSGLKLRQAGEETVAQLLSRTSARELKIKFPRVIAGKNIVEAFPNAYLGVLLPEATYLTAQRTKRWKKFDWLYEQCIAGVAVKESLSDLVSRAILTPILDRMNTTRNHDERAALVCLLTAAGVAAGQYTAVGNAATGYFFLPPWSLWQMWARQQMQIQRRRTSGVEVWVNGHCYSAHRELPGTEHKRPT